MPRIAPMLVLAATLAGGCGDEIVGYFEGSGASGDGEGTSSIASESSSGASSSGSDTLGLVPPDCLHDDFEDGVIDTSLWYTWQEEDATLEEVGGFLELTPPSFGLWDTGVVGSDATRFPFEHGRVRIGVPGPPLADRPVVIFLQIVDDMSSILSIDLAEDSVHISATQTGTQQFFETYPAAPYPAFIAVRAEGPLVHFEVSSDGSEYTILATRDKPAAFDGARALIMAQTYGDDPLRTLVMVDDFEVCVQ